MTLERRFLLRIMILLAYIVYCVQESVNDWNLPIILKGVVKNRSNEFCKQLQAQLTVMSMNPNKLNAFNEICNYLLRSFEKYNDLDNMKNFRADFEKLKEKNGYVLKHLHEQLNEKMRTKNSHGTFTYDEYLKNSKQKGMLDEHVKLFKWFGLRIFIEKKRN